MSTNDPDGALRDIRILDLSRWIAGPFSTMLLADAGADVIKVEGVHGEEARRTEPQIFGTSAYVHHYNRNKRAVAIDFRSTDGQRILRKLALDWADVVVENFRPGILHRIGLDYETLAKEKPDLIMTSVSGYGDTGPSGTRPCFNAIAEAFSGAMSLTGEADGPPLMSGYFAADHGTGLYAAVGTLMAVVERQRSGQGQHVTLALTDAMFSLIGHALTARLNNLDFPKRSGNRDNATAPADLFYSADGHAFYMDAGTDGLFASLCAVMNLPDLAHDPRFTSNESRMQNLDVLHRNISDWAAAKPWLTIQQLLTDADIPVSVVNSVDEAIAEPQFSSRGMIEAVDVGGQRLRLPGPVLKLSRTPARIRKGASAVGADSYEVLRTILHLADDEIESLAANRAIAGIEAADLRARGHME